MTTLEKACRWVEDYTGTCPRDYDDKGFEYDCRTRSISNKCQRMNNEIS